MRDRGRNAGLFLFVLPALLIAALVAAKIPDEVLRHYVLPTFLGVLLAAFVLGIRAFIQARKRQRERLARCALSHDEMRKARAKLVKTQTAAPAKNSLVPPG